MTAEEFTARLEAMEKENARLREQISTVSETNPEIPAGKLQNETSESNIQLEESNTQSVKSNPQTEESNPKAEESNVNTNTNIKVPESQTESEQAMIPPLSQRILNEKISENTVNSGNTASNSGSSLWNLTTDDLEAELARYKGWSWDKNNFTLTPYIWVWLTGTYETNQMFAGEYPLWVRNSKDRECTYFDMKATRLGLNLTCPELSSLPGTKVSGVFETDFQNTYIAENKPDLELRKAYIQLQNEKFMFIFGQTWDLISPIYPPVLNWGYGAGGGNFAFRRPQVRFDRYFKRENGRLAIQTCFLSSNTSNFSESTGTTYTGKFGSYPEFQFRLERTFNETSFWNNAMFGLGGKIGEKEYVTSGDEFHRTTWAVTAESKIRFTDRFYAMGEFYVGELLNVNCAGIMQDLNPQTRENVGSTGGWLALGWDFTPELHYTLGYSVDDPWNTRLCKGMRAKNSFIFTNISRDITKQFNVGFEYEYYQTEYYEIQQAHANLFMICAVYKL